ncbi:hypothetical protein OG937_05135 [Streptomyces sp. NBC_00510]
MRRSSLGAVAVTVALAVTALAGACGSGDDDRARSLAREACGNYEMLLQADFGVPGDRDGIREQVVPALEEGAREAAQAARLDSDWRELAQGLSRTVEWASVSLELADLKAGATPASDGTDALQVRVLSLGDEINAHDPQVQCRKAQAS